MKKKVLNSISILAKFIFQFKNSFSSYYLLGFLILFLLCIIIFLLYLYDFNLLIFCLEQSLFILFFFFLTIFYLDEFKLSYNKWIKYFQIIIFNLFIFYIIWCISTFYFENYNNLLNNIVLKINSDDIKDVVENKDIVLKGKVVLDKEAGTEVAKGISTLGSNVGLAACVGTMAAGVSKAVAKSPLPPIQKAGLIISAGIAGAVIHTGATAVNAQTHANTYINKSSVSTNQNISSKDHHEFISSVNDHTPLEILLQCICILNSICIWLIIVLLMQILFKLYISDKPKLIIIDYILPSYSEKIKIYIYKLIKLNKNMNVFYSIFAIILLFICIFWSSYFSWELYNNLSDYVDVYIEYRKR